MSSTAPTDPESTIHPTPDLSLDQPWMSASESSWAHDWSGGDVPVNDVPVSDVPVNDVPVSDVPVSDVPVNDVPVNDVPVNDVPVNDVPVNDVPVNDVPVNDVPVGDVPVGDVPVGDVPMDDPPADGVPTDGAVHHAPATWMAEDRCPRFQRWGCRGAELRDRRARGEWSFDGMALMGEPASGVDMAATRWRWGDGRSSNLSAVYAREADWWRIDLRGADLRGFYGARADLRGADLRGADLGGAVLAAADLRGADLRGANLLGSNLDRALIDATTQFAEEMAAIAPLLRRVSDRADLSNLNLAGYDFRFLNLGQANLAHTYLDRTDFRGSNLSRAHLDGCHGDAFYDHDTQLPPTFDPEAAGWFWIGPAANLAGADLRGLDLVDGSLTLANLRGADLRRADFTGADLRDADLSGADLREAIALDANFTRANLAQAQLDGADLRRAVLPSGDRYEATIQQFPTHQHAAFTPPRWNLHQWPAG